MVQTLPLAVVAVVAVLALPLTLWILARMRREETAALLQAVKTMPEVIRAEGETTREALASIRNQVGGRPVELVEREMALHERKVEHDIETAKRQQEQREAAMALKQAMGTRAGRRFRGAEEG